MPAEFIEAPPFRIFSGRADFFMFFPSDGPEVVPTDFGPKPFRDEVLVHPVQFEAIVEGEADLVLR